MSKQQINEGKAQRLEDAILADKDLVEQLRAAATTGRVWSSEEYLARAKAKWS